MAKLIKTLFIILSLSHSFNASAFNFSLKDAIEISGKVKNYVQNKKANVTSTKDINAPFDNFTSSKKELRKLITAESKTFYAECPIGTSAKGRHYPLLEKCGYKDNGNKTRANEIHYEHIFPVSWAKKQFTCWNNGGRKNCQTTSSEFMALEADPVNLVPSVGEINMNRSNYRYGELSTGFDYGTNNKILFDKQSKRFMPPEHKKGWVARVHLYMVDKYGVTLSKSYTQLMNAWAKNKPTSEECEYNTYTTKWGFENKYTSEACSSLSVF